MTSEAVPGGRCDRVEDVSIPFSLKQLTGSWECAVADSYRALPANDTWSTMSTLTRSEITPLLVYSFETLVILDVESVKVGQDLFAPIVAQSQSERLQERRLRGAGGMARPRRALPLIGLLFVVVFVGAALSHWRRLMLTEIAIARRSSLQFENMYRSALEEGAEWRRKYDKEFAPYLLLKAVLPQQWWLGWRACVVIMSWMDSRTGAKGKRRTLKGQRTNGVIKIDQRG
eukprot:5784830-Pyramimonas_sp.AAC.1